MKKPDDEIKTAPPEIDFRLTETDKRTDAWAKICTAIEARIWKLRMKNDRQLNAEETLALRVEIRILRGLLKNDPSREFSIPPNAVMQDELDAGE